MKTLILLAIGLLIKTEAIAQNKTVYEKVDASAEFTGGNQDLAKYIQTNLNYPESAKKEGFNGKCYVKFIVEESGRVSDVKIVKSTESCIACDEEALRVVKQMPNWKAAEIKGKAVSSCHILPIQFKL